jgi:anaerobic selenocysteine-containing dehydrogenase
MTKRIGTCSKDCYGSCVFIGDWDDQAQERKFLNAKPVKKHPFTNGFFCEKLVKRESLIYHPERLKHALIRAGPKGSNNFDRISLNKAIKIIANRLNKTIINFGSRSILGAYNSGNNGLLSRFAPFRFFGKVGATITSGGICNEGGCAGLNKLFGTYSITNPLQLINPKTNLIVNWGSDVANRNVHTYYLIKRAIKNGIKLISIDSRKTQNFNVSDLSFNIAPGMDHLFAQLILKQILEEQASDKHFLINHTSNWEHILIELGKINRKKILDQLNLEINEFQKLINIILENKDHTIFNIGYGIQKDFFGGRIVQTIALIQILLGNLGKAGTGIIYSQSEFNKSLINPLIDFITQKSTYEPLKKIMLINLRRELSTNDYKMLFIYNFNPVSSLPNQNQLKRSFLRKDLFTVVQEIFLTETTKYADMVIPSKFDVESDDLFSPYYIPGISINQAGPCPYEDCLTNYEFFQRLALNLGWQNLAILEENDLEIVQKCLNLLPNSVRTNVRTHGYHLLFKNEDVPFENLQFPTFDGRIQLTNISFNFGATLLNKKINRKFNEFLLITPSYKYFLHSQLGQLNSQFLKVFEKIYLNPLDIEKLKLKIGRKVKVSNDLGEADYILESLDSINQGVALIYSGSPMAINKNHNPNIFISDKPEELGYSGVYNSAIINLEKI